MTDANFKSSIILRNSLKTSSLKVTLILYLSNGHKYVLKDVMLDPSGTATVSVNDGLAEQGISSYATLFGYVEIQYTWAWDAMCVTVQSVDAVHSLIFTYFLKPASVIAGVSPASQAASPSINVSEGMWWKQEANVTGFVGLSNVSPQPIHAKLQTTDQQGNALGEHSVVVSPHGTKLVNLNELQSAGLAGGILVTSDGDKESLLISGGLQDQATGYSASMPVVTRPAASAQVENATYAALGLMMGTADPMMLFPAGTTFTPFSVLRNISEQAIKVSPTVYWMAGAKAQSASLSQLTLLPHETRAMDLVSLMSSAGVKNFNGSFNLILDTQGTGQGILVAAGSVDQTNNYVFQVTPHGVGEGGSQSLSYWSTKNGDDTMVTLWNPADEAQDFLFTLFFSGGHYQYPIHLEPRATHVFNVSEVLRSQIPDAEGNIVPASVQEGSAEISGPEGEAQSILLAVDFGIYNVRKATCTGGCKICDGVVEGDGGVIVDDPFAVAVSGTHQLSFQITWNTGAVHDYTSSSRWTSKNTAVGTVSTGLVSGVAPGSVLITALAPGVPQANQCSPTGVPAGRARRRRCRARREAQ